MSYAARCAEPRAQRWPCRGPGGTTRARPELKGEPAAEFLMQDTSGVGSLDRRGFIQLAAAGAGLAWSKPLWMSMKIPPNLTN